MITTKQNNLMNLIKFGNKKERYSVALNHNVSSEELSILVKDSDMDILNAVAENPNIDETVINIIINELSQKSSLFYMKLIQNDSFKKEWAHDFIIFLCSLPEPSNIVFHFFDNTKFFDTDDEWLELYDLINKKMPNIQSLAMGSFWTDFFGYPPVIISEKMVLRILEDFGNAINSCCNGNFDMIYDKSILTPTILIKIFELSKNLKYAPQEVKDIFTF